MGEESKPTQLLKCIVLTMSQTDCAPQAGVTWDIKGPRAELLSSSHCLCPGWSPLSHFSGCLGRGSRCHADILPGHRVLHLAAGLIFINRFSLFLLSKMRSLCAKHFISFGSSFVLVCFLTLFVEVILCSRESKGKICICFRSTKWWVHKAHPTAFAGLKQDLLPPQLNLSLRW